jgi:hypothetical protein
MYKLYITNKSIDEKGDWGDFVVYKDFTIKHSALSPSEIHGYVIQKITKKTQVFAKDFSNRINTVNNINTFTSNHVKYMNESYYEVFYILNGKSIDGDQFQNGPILHYIDGYPDDEFPTAGIIHMMGASIFIPDSKESVEKCINIQSKNITILGLKWSTSENTPANGLPYRKEIPDISTHIKSNVVHHVVEAHWNGIPGFTIKNINSINKEKQNINYNKSPITTVKQYIIQ